ncbi:M23/M56 family metallopeptidase [Agaribacterium haliotis]|uniref:M23/M56 family metallopeptidase n=1 Tax=Agaribacterium haliotis TaxID=2013869 RepID=UPI0013047966|nr:M23/M56 family metallopeptidase [Agaribacterium haliotis]
MSDLLWVLLLCLFLSLVFYALLKLSAFFRVPESDNLWFFCAFLSLFPLFYFVFVSSGLTPGYALGFSLDYWQGLSVLGENGKAFATELLAPEAALLPWWNDYRLVVVKGLGGIFSLFCVPLLFLAASLSLCSLGKFVYSNVKMSMLFSRCKEKCVNNLPARQKLLISKYRVKVLQSDKAISPFVFGLSSATLVLPGYFDELELNHRIALIDHELMHVQRKDYRKLWLLRALVCFAGFNPLLKRFEANYVDAMELSCDRDVLRLNKLDAKVYAASLFQCLKLSTEPVNRALYVAFSASAKASHSGFNKKRFQKILHGAKPANVMSSLLLGLAAMFVAVSVNASLTNKTQGVPALQAWQVPVKHYRLSSQFGLKQKIRNNKAHSGVDLAAPEGTQLFSANAGIVRIADDNSLHASLGKAVIIEHAQGLTTLYSHMQDIAVVAGQRVEAGEKIGTVGRTGKATGPHLHFELRQNDKAVDPNHFLDF